MTTLPPHQRLLREVRQGLAHGTDPADAAAVADLVRRHDAVRGTAALRE